MHWIVHQHYAQVVEVDLSHFLRISSQDPFVLSPQPLTHRYLDPLKPGFQDGSAYPASRPLSSCEEECLSVVSHHVDCSALVHPVGADQLPVLPWPFQSGCKVLNAGYSRDHPDFVILQHLNQPLPKKEYTVTITLDGASEKEVVPPYNPFIFISSNEGRGKELHLINYPPTDKADLSLLGTGKDIYRPEEGMYYVSADLMPFAINMPVSNLPVPEEGKRIDQSYPKFSGWVSSNGKQNKDWYK